jgi:hypothetical protein
MNGDGGLSPTDALRCLRALHSDLSIEPTQRCAVTWIILCADNKTGCAWASYANVAKNTGISRATIREALRRAEGEYLTRAGLGRNGAIRWKVAVQPLNCTPAPAVQPLNREPGPAVQPLTACGSTIEPILTLYTSPLKKRRGKDKGAAPPDPRVKVFFDWFSTAYKAATGNAYIVVSGAKDGALIKKLLGRLDGDDPLAGLQAAAQAMLADDWGRDGASIGLLASQINRWRKKSGKMKAAGARDARPF